MFGISQLDRLGPLAVSAVVIGMIYLSQIGTPHERAAKAASESFVSTLPQSVDRSAVSDVSTSGVYHCHTQKYGPTQCGDEAEWAADETEQHMVVSGQFLQTVCPAFGELGVSLKYRDMGAVFRARGRPAGSITQTVLELPATSKYYDAMRCPGIVAKNGSLYLHDKKLALLLTLGTPKSWLGEFLSGEWTHGPR